MNKRYLPWLFLALVACGKSPSRKDKSSTPPTAELTPDVSIDEGQSPTPANSPLLGVYLDSCRGLGSKSVAQGLEVTATAIYPVTVVFHSQNCEADAVATWGYTGDFSNFADWTAYEQSLASDKGQDLSTRFDDQAIRVEGSTPKTLIRTGLKLAASQRLRLVLGQAAIDNAAMTVKAQVSLINNVFASGEWDIAFYCEQNAKLVRQDAQASHEGSALTLTAQLNSWGTQLSFPARCQAAISIQYGDYVGESVDLAYSQFVNVAL